MRVFVALNLPYSVIQLCKNVQEHVKQLCDAKVVKRMRFVDVQRLHITLKPPMIIDQDGENDLIDALKAVTFMPFGLCTTKLNVFGHNHILWLGIQDSPELTQLASDIELKTNFGNNHKNEFMVHITLIRSFEPENADEIIKNLNKDLPVQCFQIENFVLKETIMDEAGQVKRYEDRARFNCLKR